MAFADRELAVGEIRLSFWWWGEDEAPGLDSWLRGTIRAFEAAHPGVQIDAEQEGMLEVIARFAEAAAAGRAPDLQFFWNGTYHMEQAWRGYIAPLDPLIPSDALAQLGATPLSSYRGRQYRAGWYLIPVIWVSNRRILEEASVDAAEIPPRTWGQFLEQCEQVKRAGHTPIEAGDKEGDFSVWWLTHLLVQQFDLAQDVADLFLGGRDWQEPLYFDQWTKLKAVWDAGYINPDAPEIDLWTSARRFREGRGAFTLASGPMLQACVRALGQDALVSPAPIAGRGKLAGLPIIDTQGVGIGRGSAHPQIAADFIRFMHRPEHLQRLWEEVELLPANETWQGGSQITQVEFRKMWDWFREGPSTIYIPDLMPVLFHFSGMATVGKKIMAGAMDGPGAGAFAAEVTRQWRARDAEEVEHYRMWIEALEG